MITIEIDRAHLFDFCLAAGNNGLVSNYEYKYPIEKFIFTEEDYLVAKLKFGELKV